MNRVCQNYAIALIVTYLSALTIKRYFEIFFEKMETHWVSRITWAIFLICQSWNNIYVIGSLNYITLIVDVISVLLVAINYKGDICKKTIFILIYNSIWTLVGFLIRLIFIIVNFKYDLNQSIYSFFSIIVLLGLIEILKTYLFNKDRMESLYFYNMILMIVPLKGMLMIYTSFINDIANQSLIDILGSSVSIVGILLVNIAVIMIYLRLSRDVELHQKNIIYQQEIEVYNKHIEEKENAMMEFRKARHDLKNQLIYVLQLTENKEYVELEKFIKSLLKKKSFNDESIAKTDNLVVDAVVNYKYAIASQAGIKFIVKLEVPTKLPFDNEDIFIILGNALDNAVEANERVKIDNRYIRLNMRMDISNLMISIENSFDGYINRNREGKILTVKEDNINHGIGLQCIQEVVNKYHGIMSTYITGDVFRLEILLYKK